MSYTPSNPPQADPQIKVTIEDNGNTGEGGPLSTTAIFDPVNDAPTISLPQGQTVDYDSSIEFSIATDNPIVLADLDADADDLFVVTLEAQGGTLSVFNTTEIILTSGDGVEDVLLLEFEATLDAANAALNGLSYTPSNPPQADPQIKVTIEDKSTTGTGSSPVTKAFDPINDKPVFISSPVTSATPDQLYTYNIEVSDADDDDLKVSANTKPRWLEIKNSDGKFTLSGKFEGDDYGIGSLLTDAEILNDGWRSSKWFGLFQENGTNWIYHFKLGWLYVPDQSSSQIWLYSEKLGWVWTSGSGSHEVHLRVFESDDDSSYNDQSFQIETAGTFPF
ncbi:MAG: hypothetical protein VW879_08940, partial [Opitutae bacterium]